MEVMTMTMMTLMMMMMTRPQMMQHPVSLSLVFGWMTTAPLQLFSTSLLQSMLRTHTGSNISNWKNAADLETLETSIHR